VLKVTSSISNTTTITVARENITIEGDLADISYLAAECATALKEAPADTKPCRYKSDLALVPISIVLFTIGLCSLFARSRIAAWVAIGLSDVYLIAVLFLAAYRADAKQDGEPIDVTKNHPVMKLLFPWRFTGIIVFTFILAAIITGFGGLFTTVCPDRLNTFYASFSTIVFNEPAKEYVTAAKGTIMVEFANGILVLSAAISVLISRLSDF